MPLGIKTMYKYHVTLQIYRSFSAFIQTYTFDNIHLEECKHLTKRYDNMYKTDKK